ncbi:MarR family transcriptional regulator [Brevundimonas sp.]|uniref:MarR family winged helix-turn-helix transcriptional regulator n=1 Tax=Brevundimonas sp. TaxID=1871086 RepID=UPI001A2CAA90|nr:MarR family transcriptional regulator [Brevundimonas sp.]MBJ7484758.1 MarR family transcriptional regulator [Brevundimonas sp.]
MAAMKTLAPAVTRPTNPLVGLVGYQLRRSSVVMASDFAERLDPLTLTVISLSVLLMIEANPGITQSEIGRELGIRRANMVPLTAQFAERGLVVRHRADGRSHGLHLTPKGADLARDAWVACAANETRFAAALSEAEQHTLIGLLEKLRRLPPPPAAS